MLLDKIIRECMPTKDSINTEIVFGLAHSIELDLDKVEEYRDFVTYYFDSILDEGETISPYDIIKDKNGNSWGTYYEGELLIILGKALNIIELIPNDNKMPTIFRNEMNKKSSMSI